MMRTYQRLHRFPLGSICADGFLREQMLRSKDGMGGHLYELEPGMIADPYISKTHVDAWGKGDQDGWGAEISGNYWTGYIQMAYTLQDSEMMKTAAAWVYKMMENQREDGYLGTYYDEGADIYDDYNAGGVTTAMRGLLAFYEATKDEKVLTAVHRCMRWFCKTWAGDRKTCYVAPFIIEPMVFTYCYTGDETLLAFAEEYAAYLCTHNMFCNSYRSMLEDDYLYLTNHTAAIGMMTRLPALLYAVTGKPEYLEASRRRITQVRQKSVQASGGPVSAVEYNGPVGSIAETEYCSFTYFNAMYSYMSYITGEAIYGDYMEEQFYNGVQGARKKDEKAIAYLSAPNQIYATDRSSSAIHDYQVYAPCYPVSCCPVNAVVVLPEFVRGMLLHDDAGNVYVNAYGPCTLRYADMTITETTLYPFRNTVTFTIDSKKEFTFNLKIPCWCKTYSVKVNGEAVSTQKDTFGYAAIQRAWHLGDTVEIVFDATVQVITINDADSSGKFPLAIKYGALLFSYHIPEEWAPTKGRPMTPLPDGWSWFNVTPKYEEADCADAHERLGKRREQISWNIALDETLDADSFEIEELAETGYVWSNPPLRLHTHCYKAPYLCALYPARTFESFGKYQYVTTRLPLTLVPYGCTNLRITYFPRAALKK